MIEVNNVGFKAGQIIIGLIILFLIYSLTLNTLNLDAIVSIPELTVKQKEFSTIVKDTNNSAQLAKMRFNTVFPYRMNYVPFMKMSESVNGRMGSQFTYQFWMKINDTNPNLIQNLIILLKGDDTKYRLGYYDYYDVAHPWMKELTTEPDYMIKCPLIKFGENHKHLIVEFNTSSKPNESVHIKLGNDDESNRTNPLTLLPLDWGLLTFVFQENNKEGGFKFTFYLNDKAVMNVNFQGFLRMNDGDLYLFPNLDSKADVLSISNMKYYNYARTDRDIVFDFNKGRKSYSVNERPTDIYTGF